MVEKHHAPSDEKVGKDASFNLGGIQIDVDERPEVFRSMSI